ncbi:helix-turn-helix transcriptional regulator [Xanthomonas phaseoli]|uniref:helix-turn-helix transcriptional regulator n=1 Tax=Xanthomonas phaseoli TaxID=1985254 RepID=UPI001237F6C9|nr:AlpA family phage regulatory protein [Xanthomonas phaseoli]MBO9831262.1 AlpA family phage regulatory protein [Xanthomonas phaseoli pv. dieffenbachiae]MBO9837597.1 AlpA family phage regulatory protein [Xanthomonas phaseoli pv. dieffenbachiae]MBO9839163.1 AlpA family phage regulatory protein [Xanthomonas phaseoli pv. dieffenbachiae]MBO9861232.1 AlpA family phage regulatory protein [Xanthomonas phaseoli pv. dieffenbachiae]MBO9865108.1 AlpA family phage regulatory protein [Xanthomonas phaseoli 
MQAETSKTLINRKKLLAMIPLSERTIFNMEQRGEFPRRIALTSRNVAWDLAEIEKWIETRRSSGTQAMRPGFNSSTVTCGSAPSTDKSAALLRRQ